MATETKKIETKWLIPPWDDNVRPMLDLLAARDGFRRVRRWQAESLVSDDMGTLMPWGTRYTGEIDANLSVVITVPNRADK